MGNAMERHQAREAARRVRMERMARQAGLLVRAAREAEDEVPAHYYEEQERAELSFGGWCNN